MHLHLVPVEGLLVKYETALMEHGWSYATRHEYLKRASAIIRLHEQHGLKRLDPKIFAAHSSEYAGRFYEGKINRKYYLGVHRGIKLFTAFVENGELEVPNVLMGSRQTLSRWFEKVADKYLSTDMHPNSRCDARWVTYKYFAWLEKQGFKNLKKVSAIQIQEFLLDCSSQFAMSSMHNIKLYIKKLYNHLYETGLSESTYHTLLSFKVIRESKIAEVMTDIEISKVLGAIDRTTVKGKRAYAAMLLGVVLGLRACDVATLKFSEIDWVAGELKILQSKTSNTVILPLTHDVGEALMDYILNARPKVGGEYVFLRLPAPFTPLKSAVTIGEIFYDCCKAAGIDYGKRFHTLRRSLATAMINSGSPVTDVAQTLGDTDIDSTKEYLSFDLERLSQCALPLDGIQQKGVS